MPTGLFKRTKEHCIKISEAHKKSGLKPLPRFGKKSEVEKIKIGLANKGKKRTNEHKQAIILANKGKVFSIEHREKIRLSMLGKNTKNKDGIPVTPLNKRIRKCLEYKLWRKAVFERDNYTCVFCCKIGGMLNADHIKPFALYPELRFAIDNGRTLCVSCHRKTDTYGNRKTNLVELGL